MTANRLGREASSYLKTAAHQPTHWYAWGPEAFAAAREEDKPILLDIGAVWCHWCHVMDHESYEDPAVAEIINRDFIAIKVDRDERPDVDARYQRSVQAMIGQGGWPLTVFLLPDGRPYYGGTYFPPRDAHGRPSFARVLAAVAEAYRHRREEAMQSAANLAAHLAQRRDRSSSKAEISNDLLETAVGTLRDHFDAQWGGFGRAPKFPHPAAHDFLLAQRSDKAAADIVTFTLERMRAGGVYDQVAGGYHRYSVDRTWHVPHFEKMLYDNAGLLRNHSRAAWAFGRRSDEEAAREVADWMLDVLQQPGGGFGGSQDADVEAGDDGDFFTWSFDEVRAVIPDAETLRVVQRHFGLSETPAHMHHDPTRNVLRVEADAHALASALRMPLEEVERRLAEGLSALRAARAERVAPFVDPTLYANWNGMAIQALLEHGGRTGDKRCDAAALKALDRFLGEAYERGRGFARSPGSATFGLLDDNAQMLDALLEAHFATGDERYLSAAREVGALLIEKFPHPAGGFADRAADVAPAAEAAPLSTPERPIEDAPTASGNGVALRALLRLAEATQEARWHDAARTALEALALDAQRMGLFAGALLLAMHDLIDPPPRLECAPPEAAWARPLARRLARPGAVLTRPGADLPQGAVLVCYGNRCLAPAGSPVDLEARLKEA